VQAGYAPRRRLSPTGQIDNCDLRGGGHVDQRATPIRIDTESFRVAAARPCRRRCPLAGSRDAVPPLPYPTSNLPECGPSLMLSASSLRSALANGRG
jgi:hypothetical protein